MKSTFVWLLLAGAVLLLGDAVDAWNRQIFNRYSRNLLRNSEMTAAAASNQLDEFNALFGINSDAGRRAVGGGGGGGGGGGPGFAGGGGIGNGAVLAGIGNMAAADVDKVGVYPGQQQQTEVYGIVEPLIEDTPCVDRPCELNDDCCPTGVCVNTYGEGKCIYVYGRKRDLCHRHADCEPGMSCLRGNAGNLLCQPNAPAMHVLGTIGGGGSGGGGGGGSGAGNAASGALPVKQLEMKQFGEDCLASSECNVAKGMCCQLQRSHHRMLPRKLCAYFRDPFMCIDIMPTENEEIRESRFLSSFSQRRM